MRRATMGTTPAIKGHEAASDEFRNATDQVVREFQMRRPLRTGSLVISLFGDAIAPHGGAVWQAEVVDAG